MQLGYLIAQWFAGYTIAQEGTMHEREFENPSEAKKVNIVEDI